jgi:hypothetical protein
MKERRCRSARFQRRALAEQPTQSLQDLEKFDGAGIYALYYSGNFPAYSLLAEANREEPGSWAIYIGKAETENARKGDPNQAHTLVGNKLYNRVRKHAASIEQASNLDLTDFHIRVLTVAPTWVPLAEVGAIRMHRPVWNAVVDGLGNHDPGAGRANGMRPRWDTLHPGRAWAEKLSPHSETAEAIAQDVRTFLQQRADFERN